MKQKVIETIKKYNLIQPNDKIIVGVSGGPDSISLLDILLQLKDEFKFEVIVAHVNHQIRKSAVDDEEYVLSYCKKNDVKCYIKKADVLNYATTNKIGTEEAGRKIRYEFFEELLKKENANKIAIAHNKNDKVETIIMNEIRGTGIAGLRGIDINRDNKYIRPILEISRKEIEEYCEDRNLKPRIDETNFINDYTRNKIRNIVIPYLQREFNPNIVDTIDRLSDLIIEEDNYMNKITKQVYEKIKIGENEKSIILDLNLFNREDFIIKKRIIIHTIKKVLGNSQNIEKVNIEDIIKLCANNIGNKYLMPNKNIKVLVKNKKIYFEKQV